MRPFFEHVVDAIRSSAAERETTIRQVRLETRNTLAEHRSMRQAVAYAMRRKLHKHRAAMIDSLRSTLAPVVPRNVAPTIERQQSLEEAPAERVGVWELWADPAKDPDEKGGDQLQTEVLRRIEAHPEGVRALELGNELGVDWRRVLGVTHDLVEAGMVEQVEQEFYPVGKASRRW